jgi:hypothetical protein
MWGIDEFVLGSFCTPPVRGGTYRGCGVSRTAISGVENIDPTNGVISYPTYPMGSTGGEPPE